MDYRIVYSSNSVSDGFPTVLTVSSSASPVLTVSSNADQPGPTPVGVFSAAPAVVRTEALVEAAQRLMRSRGAKPAPALPGQVVRRLAVVSSSGTEERYATEASTPEAEFSAAEAQAIALAERLRQHPRTALSGYSAFRPVGPERLGITMKLVNVGTAPLAVPHPDVWGDGGAGLTMTMLRNDIPLADLTNEHQHFIHLSRAQLADAQPPLQPGATVVLAPGSAMTLVFATGLAVPGGGYDIWTTLEIGILDPEGGPPVRAELLSEKGQWQSR